MRITELKHEELVEFIAFCKAKAPDEPYDFTMPHQCALTQFGIATERTNLVNADLGFGEDNGINGALCVHGDRKQWTFGALAQRLETLL